MKKKQILLTGSTGFIGSNLTRKLTTLGYRPTLLVRGSSSLWRIADLKEKVDLVMVDLLDKKALSEIFFKTRPDVVYHLASYGVNQREENNLDEMVKYNILGARNLLEMSVKNGVGFFVNTGSSSEYGFKNKPMAETDVLSPINLYGVTKSSVSQLVYIYSKTNKMPAVTLRLFSPYGYFEDKNRFIPTVCLNAITGRSLELSNPNYVRDFIFIEDVVEAYTLFLDASPLYGEIINIGSGVETKLEKVVSSLGKITGNKLDVVWKNYQSNQSEPDHWRADIKKAEKLIEWLPRTKLFDGLEKTVRWFRDNLYLYQ